MTFTQLKYGFAAVVTGVVITGTTIYVVNRLQVKQVDDIEILQAIIERAESLRDLKKVGSGSTNEIIYQVSTDVFTSEFTDGTNTYTKTNTIGFIVNPDFLQCCDNKIKELIPYFIRNDFVLPTNVFPTNIITMMATNMYTTETLFAELGVGDGTNQFTKAPAIGTNLARYSGDYPSQIYTNTRFEMYKVLHALNRTWVGGGVYDIPRYNRYYIKNLQSISVGPASDAPAGDPALDVSIRTNDVCGSYSDATSGGYTYGDEVLTNWVINRYVTRYCKGAVTYFDTNVHLPTGVYNAVSANCVTGGVIGETNTYTFTNCFDDGIGANYFTRCNTNTVDIIITGGVTCVGITNTYTNWIYYAPDGTADVVVSYFSDDSASFDVYTANATTQFAHDATMYMGVEWGGSWSEPAPFDDRDLYQLGVTDGQIRYAGRAKKVYEATGTGSNTVWTGMESENTRSIETAWSSCPQGRFTNCYTDGLFPDVPYAWSSGAWVEDFWGWAWWLPDGSNQFVGMSIVYRDEDLFEYPRFYIFYDWSNGYSYCATNLP